MKPYPIFLIGLENRHCIVIGGGEEATHKVQGLLDVNAQITVINPHLIAPLHDIVESGKVTWIQRDYQEGDLQGAFLVIAERSTAEQNDAIYAEGEREKAIVNVMDDVKNCNFVAGSVIRQGPLTISISTSGAAPAYSVRTRERFEQEFDEIHGEYLDLLQALRPPMKRYHACFKQRRELWYKLVDSELLQLMREGEKSAVYAHIRSIVGNDVTDVLMGKKELAPPLADAHTICGHQCKLPLLVEMCPFEEMQVIES